MTNRVKDSIAKDSFLEKIRIALGRSMPLVHSPGHPPLKTTLPRHQEKVRALQARTEARQLLLIARLLEVAAQVGWEVYRAHSDEEAASIAGRIARHLRVRRVVRSGQAIFRRVSVDRVFRNSSISSLTLTSGRFRNRSDIRRLAWTADLAVVGADYIVADTATCAFIAGKGMAQVTAIAPPAIVVLAEVAQLVESLDDLFTLRRLEHLRTRGRMSHALTLISGPSQSMEIELTPTPGLHGPAQAFLIFIAP